MSDELLQIAVPVLPEHLIEQLKGAEYNKGEYYFNTSGYNLLVPGLTTQSYELYVSPLIYVIYKKHTLTSTFYDPLFTLMVRIDDPRIDLFPAPIPFETPKELTLSYFLAAKIKLTYQFTNPFFFDILVTLHIETIRMQRNFYEGWYRTLLNASEEKLNEIVMSEGGITI
jgi:hypothetical protein